MALTKITDKQVTYKQGSSGSVIRNLGERLRERVSIQDMGGSSSALAAANDSAIADAIAVSNLVWVPDGTYQATTASVPYLKDLDGPGFIQIGSDVIPCGDIESNLSLSFPSVFSSMADVFTYLSTRSIRRGATVTINIASGTHTFTGDGIEPYHPDGARINIIGAGSGTTTLKFTGLGAASSKAGIRLIGPYYLGLLNGVTLDGDNWNGHSSGSPTLGAGDPNDPMAVQAKNGASITLGTDVKAYRWARNGVFAYQGSTIKADSVQVTECGSDGIVASTGSNVRAISAVVTDCWGVGIYADLAGVVWASSATATGMKLRGGTSGGDGFSAVSGGTVYADSSISIKNADTGYTAYAGTIIASSATAGGSAINANTGGGIRCQYSGKFIGDNVVSTYNTGPGLLLSGGGEFFGTTLNTSFNGGNGATISDGSTLVSQGFISMSNTGKGLSADRASSATVIQCDIQSNTSDGIYNSGARIRATSAVFVKNNGGYGVFTRQGGAVDMTGVSELSKVTGNTSGSFSPAKDTSTGIAQSFNYASA